MRLHIAVYAFDGVTMFHLSIPQAVFGSVARLGLADWEVGLFTTRPAPGRESPESGIGLAPPRSGRPRAISSTA